MYRKTVIDGVEILDINAPISVQLELTSSCNYQCNFCYNVWKSPSITKSIKPLKKEQFFAIIDKISPVVFSMIISGGEPTLVPWLPDLISHITKYQIWCSLITNGALIDSDLAYKLKESGLRKVQVSLHHFKDAINDSLTGSKNSVTKTLTGASNLLSLFGTKKININMVASKETAKDVYEMGKFLYQNGFVSFSVGMKSCSGASQDKNSIPDTSDVVLVWKQLSKLIDDFGMKTGFVGSTPICAIPPNANSRVHFYNMCDAAINHMVISPNGDCRPCVELPVIGGNILTDPISKIWSTPVFDEIRMFKNVPPECHKCMHVSSCHGGCRASAYNFTKSITGKSPLMATEIPDEFILG